MNDTPNNRGRLDYLDGLRGLTALYVVLFHCRSEFTWRLADGGFSPALRMLTEWMNFGHYAVVVFIVLSGYCLMLPVVRSQAGGLAGGIGGYLKRRARRTLPAYYGAMAFTLLLIALVPGLQHPADAQWDRCLPAFQRDVLLSHLLMLQNLRFEWHQTINAPFWSMATEWDIYLIFALVLLPLWKRQGTMTAVGVAMLLGLLPHLLPKGSNYDWACPWFLGCFALGMAGAVIGFSQEAKETQWRTRTPWSGLAVVFGVIVLLICVACPALGGAHWMNVDPLVAATTACALVAAARRQIQQEKGDTSAVLRLLGSRPLRSLGAFSYSLYLIHFPLLALVHVPLRHWGWTPDAAYLCLTLIGVPLSMLTAFLFSRVFERPSQRPALRPQLMPTGQKPTATRKAA